MGHWSGPIGQLCPLVLIEWRALQASEQGIGESKSNMVFHPVTGKRL